MPPGPFRLISPFLSALDPETSHWLTVRALQLGLVPAAPRPADPALSQRLFGLDFPNPLGLAAGADKNGEVPDAMLALGFGFTEVGTVTPLQQPGNPPPRLFRLEEDEALINRLGFNNDGHEAVLGRLKARRGRGILGVNIGANKDSPDRIADYAQGVATFHATAAYLTINVSSPNTPGLRGLQSRAELDQLLARVMQARDACASRIPLLLKVAPDLGAEELSDVVELSLAAGIDGLIVSNTTVSRPPLRSRHAAEPGGLSGRPLFELSTRKLAEVYRLSQGRLPLIGVGGIDSAEAAWQKVRAGASLIQLYTALVYHGPDLILEIVEGLAQRLKSHGFTSIREAVGTGAAEWAKYHEPGGAPNA